MTIRVPYWIWGGFAPGVVPTLWQEPQKCVITHQERRLFPEPPCMKVIFRPMGVTSIRPSHLWSESSLTSRPRRFVSNDQSWRQTEGKMWHFDDVTQTDSSVGQDRGLSLKTSTRKTTTTTTRTSTNFSRRLKRVYFSTAVTKCRRDHRR